MKVDCLSVMSTVTVSISSVDMEIVDTWTKYNTFYKSCKNTFFYIILDILNFVGSIAIIH